MITINISRWADSAKLVNESFNKPYSGLIRRGLKCPTPHIRTVVPNINNHEYIDGPGTLDEANGRTGLTPEFPSGTYYYIVTDDFPGIPRYFRGTPSLDFKIGM